MRSSSQPSAPTNQHAPAQFARKKPQLARCRAGLTTPAFSQIIIIESPRPVLTSYTQQYRRSEAAGETVWMRSGPYIEAALRVSAATCFTGALGRAGEP